MKQLNRTNFQYPNYPSKIMQFGEGNFLRAFFDWQIDLLNQQCDLGAGVSIIRPIDYDALPLLNTQDGLYTSIVRGIDEAGQAVQQTRVISCVNEEIPVYQQFERYLALAEDPNIELVVSNTTEAGIEFIGEDKLDDKPAKAFPAKLTQWLYHRYQHFAGAADAGVILLPCELIDYNGEKLKEIVLKYCDLWQLEAGFVEWLNSANEFCSTLVDRIVTGFPRDEHAALQSEFGYADNFMVTSEYFHLFVIQGSDRIKQFLKLAQSDLNIIVVDDIAPYKQRKVAILNGAHTAMVPLAYLAGLEAVKETVEDPLFSRYVRQFIFDEVIPTLNFAEDEISEFAEAVITRFQNPYIHHLLISISLNSMTKYTTRILPQLLAYQAKTGELPKLMIAALAGQILFYRGLRDGQQIPLKDDEFWLTKFASLWAQYQQDNLPLRALVHSVLAESDHWGQDLNQVACMTDAVTANLEQMLQQGVRATLAPLLA
ncbi:tagaturonate reductase [Shewanella avicenniae]|uniref:Tagaturonate reductase n=1 Tax=Shewanella avicenniae TaxID=2814294 RepID=A0ABX7QL00_9GAMM|nr:tagaturonate reductase [Shewanella avicenniae]QSX32129.1 tagaturonate reductase [Shewanella avicenniae]